MQRNPVNTSADDLWGWKESGDGVGPSKETLGSHSRRTKGKTMRMFPVWGCWGLGDVQSRQRWAEVVTLGLIWGFGVRVHLGKLLALTPALHAVLSQ